MTTTPTPSARSRSPPNTNTNPLVGALLTDLYQLTMVYAYWKAGKVDEPSVFELFFRKNPFEGGYTVFCGLDECLKFLDGFRFDPDDIEYLRSLPSFENCEEGFFDYLSSLDLSSSSSSLRVSAVPDGTIVFPRCPLITVEGPLGICQLLETTLLNLVNFPSLVATNASRMVSRASSPSRERKCFEFGLRRAQGPDGGLTASRSAYVGGFAGTSNVRAGKEFGIPLVGTMAHAYVQSFSSLEEVSGTTNLRNRTTGEDGCLLETSLGHRGTRPTTNDGELAAFCAYACAFPDGFLCLIDTYDTIASGLENFVAVAKALVDFGYEPRGVRLDSGDLVGLSLACKRRFEGVAVEEGIPAFSDLAVVASNDINEEALVGFSRKDHGMTAFGIGTHLVTCQAQPALGCVYKLVELGGKPRIKLSEETGKTTLPGRKRIFRLYGGPDGKTPLADRAALATESPPVPGETVMCVDPLRSRRRIAVIPKRAVELQHVVFPRRDRSDDIDREPPLLSETRDRVRRQLEEEFGPIGVTTTTTTGDGDGDDDPATTTRYELLVSPELRGYLDDLWEANAPVPVRR